MYIDPLSMFGPAGGANLPGYIGSDAVRKAIHATQSPNKVYHLELFNNGYIGFTHNYAACALEIDYKGPGSAPSMIDVYHGLIDSRKKGGSAENLRVIVVSSGDTDPVVALHGTEAAVTGLELPLMGDGGTGGARRPWFYQASAVPVSLLAHKPSQFGNDLYAKDAGVQVGGFVTSYDTGVTQSRGFENNLLFEFVTVHASGHMVPQYAPQRAHHILDRLLLGMEGSAKPESKILSPLLPQDWATTAASTFYDYEGKMGKQGGMFAKWVVEAMGTNYTQL
jgi:cathepsin A (carboxypeptidase C)